jgi:DNA sulfur modification protein DndE
MAIRNIHISQREKDYLIKLKRITGLENWNQICRWAFCVSLAEPTPPSTVKISSDSSTEMTWETFGGPYHEIYTALLKHRCQKDGLTPEFDNTLSQQFRLHLHRGLSYLASERELSNIATLTNRLTL